LPVRKGFKVYIPVSVNREAVDDVINFGSGRGIAFDQIRSFKCEHLHSYPS
jgi:hypothetical protein